MAESSESTRAFRFGAFEADLRAGELRKNGLKVKLQEKPFQVLAALLECPGETVSRGELRAKLWPADTFVDFDHSLNTAVNKLRAALGDSAGRPRFVETLGRRGYRFAAPVVSMGATSRRSQPAAPIESLAVLPFENGSGDPEAEYLSDGITESIINSMSQLPRLQVMARSRVFRYKGRGLDPQAAGRELNVRAVLTGRVVQRGDTLTIRAELMDVAEGWHLWGQQYNRRSADILVLEEEIARKISEKLRLKLTGEQKKQLGRRSTGNPEAYHAYLKGRYYGNQSTAEGLRRSIEYFQKAVESDPDYALAYAGLAECYSVLGVFGLLPPREVIPQVKTAAARALAADDGLAEAHTFLAVAGLFYDWDWTGAGGEIPAGHPA